MYVRAVGGETNMQVRYYEDDRIYFRPLEISDASTLVVWLNDPENWRTLGRYAPINQMRETEFIQKLCASQTDIVFGIVLKTKDRLIGCCGLHNISLSSRSATFGILIGEKSKQGIGLGTAATRLILRYAFDELNLNRVELSVFADHDRAIRVYRRAGFVQEGRARQAFFRNGRYHDALTFGILRDEWEDRSEQQNTGIGRLTSMTV